MTRDERNPDEVVTLTEIERLGIPRKLVTRAILDPLDEEHRLVAHHFGGRTWRVRWADFVDWRERTRVQPRRIPTERERREARADERVRESLRKEQKIA